MREIPAASASEGARFCRLCDIMAEMPEDVTEYADRLYRLLDEKDRADEETIRRRLSVCGSCPKQVGGTCLACGCYVLIRASAERSRCPKKKW
ncbi:MAG: DUF6171 family protein [Lachnospiraceae bacterium]|nr:DUF6171 family protein [Lachnospiraceae bacterium]